MNQPIPDFLSINEHVEQTFQDAFLTKSLTKDLANSKLCGIYNVVRPILVALASLPIIPQKWRLAITAFVSVMDTICPQT